MNIANVLLEITGSSDDARRDLQQTAAELAAFDRIDAEAEADVETTGAKAKIAELRARLAALAKERVEIDVDVRRGFDDLIARGAASISAALQGLTGRLSGASEGFSDIFNRARIFGFSLTTLAGGVAVLVPIVIALAAALTAVVASLAAATAGAAALGIAFAALLGPAVVLGIGAVQHFKEQADVAGSAANRLQSAAEKLGSVFSRALGPAADAVFRGLTGALRAITPMVGRLEPVFTRLGQAVGDSFRAIGRELASPAWERFFSQMTSAAAKLSGPLTQGFIALARILRNIATAAMPFLIRGFQAMARSLQGLAAGTANAERLRGVIGGLVAHLRSWIGLAGAVGDVMISLFSAIAGEGKSIVDSLADGARSLADWIRSAEGQEQIRQFFSDIGPLVSALGELFGKLVVAALRFTQVMAPVLAPIVRGISQVVDAVNLLLGALLKIPAPIRGALGSITALVLGFGRLQGVRAVIAVIIGALGGLGGALRGVIGAVRSAFQGAVNAVRSVGGALVGAARAVVNLALAAVRARVGAYIAAGRALVNGIRAGIMAALGLVRAAAAAVARAGAAAVRGVTGAFSAAGRALIQAAANGVRAVIGAVRSAARSVAQAGAAALRGLVGAFTAAGQALMQGFLNGIQAVGDQIIATVEGIANDAKNALEGALDILSPSRVTYEIGAYFSEGFARGIRDAGRAAVAEARALALESLGSLQVAAVGPLVPTAAAAAAGSATSGVGPTYNTTVQPLAGGGSPDPNVLVGQLDAALRARGGFR